MKSSLSTSLDRPFSANSAQLTIRVDPQVQRQAEAVARARGTTLTRMLSEYVQSLAECEQWYGAAHLEWLENPRNAFMSHLEQKHR